MTRLFRRIPFAASALLAVFLSTTISSSLSAQIPADAPAAPSLTALTDAGWPRIIAGKGAKIIIYQPQIDSWNGFQLEARAAVAVTPTSAADKPPTYGIVKITAHTHVDKDAGMVTLEKLTVKSASFPGSADKGRAWASMIQAGSANLRPISLERFESAVASTGAQRRGEAMPVKNDPPVIAISTVPSMPILIDGDPIYREVPHTSLMRVLNTRPLLLRDGGGTYYLKVFDGWMRASSLTGEWTVAASVPSACDIALKAAIEQKAVDLLVGGNPKDASGPPSLKTQAPKIFVTTKPTELLVFEGQPKFLPISGTKLMYASNTTGRVFVDEGNEEAYVLVAGRWFAGPSTLTGPWAFVPGDKLPDDFRRIPDDSPVENVKASIPGTEQADEAIVANSVPQTALVKRSSATCTPAFDGEPRLEPIEGTRLRWVVNASLPIVAVGTPTEYFGVQNAVWFVASSLNGPWLVATTVPAAVYSIPVSSPLHYITYVRVYDYTPDDVIVGYTPGYSGVYVSDGCIVYGTGFYYQPWIGTVWYGQPVTYGFGVAIAYTPWAGWYAGFGFGWTWGAATAALGWGWGPYPWWGGYGWGAYYPWTYAGGAVAWGPRGGVGVWGPGYFAATTGNIYQRWATTAVTRTAGGYNAWTGNQWAGQVGRAYNSRTGVAAAGERGAVGNVYTGDYAAGARGAAENTRTGAAVAGRTGTFGNADTGREATASQGIVRGTGGQVETYNAIRGDEGGAARVGNNVYAGHDGEVYRNSGGGWEHYTPGSGWTKTERPSDSGLDHERAGRINGNWRSGAARSGGFHGGFGGGRLAGGRRR